MKLINYLFILGLSAPLSASVIQFQPNTPVKATEINSNFSFIKGTMLERNAPINFSNFSKGQLILKEELETEFDKMRGYGITVSPLLSTQIKAEELNQAFLQMSQGAVNFDDVPVAQNLSVTTNEDTLVSRSFPVVNTTGTTSILTESLPAHGSLTIIGTNFSFTPEINYFGNDSFSYKAYDGRSYSEIKTVSLNILSVNDVPVSSGQSLTTIEDQAKVISLAAVDVESSTLTYSVVTQPLNGSVVVVGNQATYIPASNFNGVDSFTFKANDGEADSTSATISITVSAVNDAPVANNNTLALNEDANLSFALSGSDVEGSSLTYTILTQPSHGVITGTAPNLIYTPTANYFGSDSFTFKVRDGALDSAPGTITFNVAPINDAPISYAQSISNDLNSKNITLTATDVDGDNLTYSIVTSPSNGVASVSGATATYTPGSTYTGADSFTYRVFDGTVYSATNTISINNISRWPVGKDGPLVVPAGQTVTLTAGLIYDYSSITVNAGGTLRISGSSNVTVLASKGPVQVDGTVVSASTLVDAGAYSLTTPNGIVFSYQPARAPGGSGGMGGSWKTFNKGWGYGGSQNNGRGGGGGSGANDGSAGRPGISGASWYSDTTKSHGGAANGLTAGAGGGCDGGYGPSGYQAAGGGGGYPGVHGLSLALYTKSTISGAGTIDLRGATGFNGGSGGVSGYAGGGGGGGGSGGSGGKLWLKSSNSGSLANLLSGGGGGAGGVGPYNGGAVAAQYGAGGASGYNGTVEVGTP